MILGIDTSTRVTGYCLLEDDGTQPQVDYIAFKGTQSLYERVDAFQERICDMSDITAIYIEECAMMFSGKSTAHVLSLLQRWNGMVSYAVYKTFGIEPQGIVAQTARKLAGITMPKDRGNHPKEIVVKYIRHNNLLPEDTWKYKKTGLMKDYCYDMADAYIIALAGFRSQAGAFS